MALLGACSVIRGLLAGAERDEVLTRHRAGEALRTLKRAPETYGTQSVERVAAELGMSARVLYRYIAVAESWSESQLKVEIDRTNRFGQPLSWSHFLALAKVDDARSRALLIDECLANAWSVRELTQRMQAVAERAAGRERNRGEAVRAALNEWIHTGDRAVTDLRVFADALGDRLAEPGDPIDEQLLARAVETFEELQAHAESTLGQLRGAYQTRRRLRCGPDDHDGVTTAEVSSHDDSDDAGSPPVASRRTRARLLRK